MLKRAFQFLLLAVILVVLLRHAGSFLIVNNAQQADLIVVLGGGNEDTRYLNAVRLMSEGWAPRLMLDVFDKGQTFGHRDVDLAQDFLNRTTPGRSTICPIAENSTYDEARYVERCLGGTAARSILVVTSAYHTRRALEILRKRLPQYYFSMYPVAEPYYFDPKWWTSRERAKTALAEWQRYLWWEFVDRWRSGVVLQ